MRPYRVVADSRKREEWLQWRKKLITASDVWKVIRGSKSEYERLLAEKRGEVEPKNLDNVKPVAAGKYAELPILQLWRHFGGRRFKQVPYLCQSTKYPFLGATPDAYAWSDIAGETGVVEVKLATTCMLTEGGRLINEYTRKTLAKWDPEPPQAYQLQHDTQMYVCGKSFGWIVAGIAFSNVLPFPRKFDTFRKRVYESDIIPPLEDFARKARLI